MANSYGPLESEPQYKAYEQTHFHYAAQFCTNGKKCQDCSRYKMVMVENGPPLTSGVFVLYHVDAVFDKESLKALLEDVCQQHQGKPWILMATGASRPTGPGIDWEVRENIKIPGYNITSSMFQGGSRKMDDPSFKLERYLMNLNLKLYSPKTSGRTICPIYNGSPEADLQGYSEVSGLNLSSLKHALTTYPKKLDCPEFITAEDMNNGNINALFAKYESYSELEHVLAGTYHSQRVGVKNNEGKIVATGCLISTKENPQIGGLFEIAVSPQFQRQGYGRAIMDALLSLASTRLNQVILMAQGMNSGFFRKFGFVATSSVYIFNFDPV